MRVLVTISGHGLGHLAQCALVIEALRRAQPQTRLTVWSALPRERLATRIAEPFDYHHDADDFGLHMQDSMRIRLRESAEHYERIHARLIAAVGERARRMEDSGADVVLANVSYLAVAAAATSGLPALAMCSLNWADVWAHFFAHRPGAARIHEQMLEAYRSATVFLRPEPSMPMPGLGATREIGAIARLGRRRRRELARSVGAPPDARIALVTLRGADRPPLESWPDRDRWLWLVPAEWQARHRSVIDIEAACASSGLEFPDLVASADALIAKPGYGTFTEAACNRARVMYVRRPDWPEQEALIPWLERHVPAIETSPSALRAGPSPDTLAGLLAREPGDAVVPRGIGEAAGELARLAR